MLVGAVMASLTLLGATPAIATAAQADLGGPDVSGYCQHLGFSGAGLSPPPNQQWQCLRADGSAAPVDLQGACEFSFSQRPVFAKQLTAGVPYTWQCVQGLDASGSEGGAAQPTSAQLRSALVRALRPVGSAARIAALRHKGSYAMRFQALIPGSLRVSWSYLPSATRAAKAKPVTVAVGRAGISRAGTVSVKIVLSAAGRRLLKHARHIAITARGSFSATGRAALVAAVRFTLAR